MCLIMREMFWVNDFDVWPDLLFERIIDEKVC